MNLKKNKPKNKIKLSKVVALVCCVCCLSIPINTNAKDLKEAGASAKVGLFSMDCGGIKYTGEVEDALIEELETLKQNVKTMSDPLLSSNRLDTILFSYSFAICAQRTWKMVQDDIETDGLAPVIQVYLENLDFIFTMESGTSGLSALTRGIVEFNDASSTAISEIMGFLQRKNIFATISSCMEIEKKKVYENMYNWFNWKMSFDLNVISSISSSCNYSLVQQGEDLMGYDEIFASDALNEREKKLYNNSIEKSDDMTDREKEIYELGESRKKEETERINALKNRTAEQIAQEEKEKSESLINKAMDRTQNFFNKVVNGLNFSVDSNKFDFSCLNSKNKNSKCLNNGAIVKGIIIGKNDSLSLVKKIDPVSGKIKEKEPTTEDYFEYMNIYTINEILMYSIYNMSGAKMNNESVIYDEIINGDSVKVKSVIIFPSIAEDINTKNRLTVQKATNMAVEAYVLFEDLNKDGSLEIPLLIKNILHSFAKITAPSKIIGDAFYKMTNEIIPKLGMNTGDATFSETVQVFKTNSPFVTFNNSNYNNTDKAYYKTKVDEIIDYKTKITKVDDVSDKYIASRYQNIIEEILDTNNFISPIKNYNGSVDNNLIALNIEDNNGENYSVNLLDTKEVPFILKTLIDEDIKKELLITGRDSLINFNIPSPIWILEEKEKYRAMKGITHFNGLSTNAKSFFGQIVNKMNKSAYIFPTFAEFDETGESINLGMVSEDDSEKMKELKERALALGDLYRYRQDIYEMVINNYNSLKEYEIEYHLSRYNGFGKYSNLLYQNKTEVFETLYLFDVLLKKEIIKVYYQLMMFNEGDSDIPIVEVSLKQSIIPVYKNNISIENVFSLLKNIAKESIPISSYSEEGEIETIPINGLSNISFVTNLEKDLNKKKVHFVNLKYQDQLSEILNNVLDTAMLEYDIYDGFAMEAEAEINKINKLGFEDYSDNLDKENEFDN